MSLSSIVMMSLFEIVGDFGWKGVARAPTVANWMAGSLGYLGVIYFLTRSLSVANVTYTNGMWDGVSALLSTLAAYFIFGERLNTSTQYLSLVLIIIGILVLKAGGIPY